MSGLDGMVFVVRFLCLFVRLFFRSFPDLKSLQFGSEYTILTELPGKHLSNWPQGKGYSSTKPFTLETKMFPHLPTDG